MSETKASKHPQSAFTLFAKSKEAVQRNLKLFIIVYILPFLFAVFDMGAKQNVDNRSQWFEVNNPFVNVPTGAIVAIVGFGLVLAIIGMILAALYQAFVTALELVAATGKKATFPRVWEMTKKYVLRLFGFGIVYAVLIVIGIVLLIVPGLIVIRRYFLAPYAIVDKNMGIFEAMRYSADISKPFAGSIWGVIGVMILISLVGIVPIFGGVISLVLAMLYSVAPAIRYRELSHMSA